MEERRRTAKNVERGKVHTVANESRVIHEVTVGFDERSCSEFPSETFLENVLMGQHRCLGITSRATGKLQIAHIVWS